MNSKTFVLPFVSLIIVLLALSFSSATVDFVNVNGATQTINHNSQATISFNVQATTFAGNITNAQLVLPALFGGSVEWSGDIGAFDLIHDSTSALKTVNILVPNHRSAGVYSGFINLTGTYTDGDLPVIHALPISITVSPSPSLSITNTQSLTKTQNGIITITNTGNTVLSSINLSASGDFNVSFSQNNIALNPGAVSSAITITPSPSVNLSDLGLGKHEVTITAKDLSQTAATDAITYSVVSSEFCEEGNINTSKISITNLEDTSSDDEWEWKPLDEVEIEVEVENNLDDDEDFIVEFALYDSEDNDFVELDGEDTLLMEISIDEDDSEKITFEFKVPADIEESDGRYVAYVKAYVDGDEETYCNSYAGEDVPSSSVTDIKITRETNEVVLDEISTLDMVQAGETVTVSAQAINIGTKDEDKVKVTLTNTKLGLNLESSTFGLDFGDSDLVDFSFVVPSTAENGVYVLKLTSYYKYKSSSDSYSDHSDVYEVRLTVVGGANATTTSGAKLAGITATLESDAKAGEEMEIRTTIKNIGTNKSTFVIGVEDYDSWAVLNSISDRILTLNAGESKDITIKFTVNKDASGEQTFTIQSLVGDKLDSKEVTVEIESGSIFSSLASSLNNKTILWVIGAINVILILLIIYLAIRFFRR
jgi:hypothetical protein